jgi:hypothetical protein
MFEGTFRWKKVKVFVLEGRMNSCLAVMCKDEVLEYVRGCRTAGECE